MSTLSKKRLGVTAIILLSLIGLGALSAGYSFISDPSGRGVGIPLHYIRHSPFRNFFIPGLVLFFAIGVFSVLTAIVIILNGKFSSALILVQGLVLTLWIIAQIAMVRDFNFLHLACLLFGIALMVIGWKIMPARI